MSDEKIRIVEACEDSLRYHEKDLEFKALELDEREESVMARERDYNQLVDDVQSKAFKLRREYRCRHKVVMIFVLVLFISYCFRIVRSEAWLIVALSPPWTFVEMRTSWLDIM